MKIKEVINSIKEKRFFHKKENTKIHCCMNLKLLLSISIILTMIASLIIYFEAYILPSNPKAKRNLESTFNNRIINIITDVPVDIIIKVTFICSLLNIGIIY